MAIIPLRTYNHEIEGMIDNRQLDEAVAHCRHILTTFPKHIATYRLLGKAHLEQQRISDATDIFQRVLSSVPDDFIANVGMSIIREDENNLDASIWHMEMAYEVQPENVAIQDELRRLYGRRDGVQPPKARLTRGALARMYSKGGLYDLAIAELRAAISEDPNRPDLQLLLAEMYFETSQRVEAVETCANILKKIPLCLEANRILAVSLPEAEGSEAVRNYRQTVIAMDPYYAFAPPEALTSDQVPENAVNIERLEWKSGIHVPETPPQPNWATSLGISIEKPAEENMPDWLKSAEAPIPAPISEKAGPSVSPFIWDTQEVKNIISDTSKPEAEIPDWMKDAGWRPSSGEVTQPPVEAQPEEPVAEAVKSGDLEKAEIPEWLRGIAPEGVLGESQPPEQPPEGDLSTPWLEQHQPGPTDSIIQWLEENKPETPPSRASREQTAAEISEEEVPDWLKDLEPAQPQPAPPEQKVAPTPAFTVEPSAFIEEISQPETPEAPLTPSEAAPEQGLIPAEEIQPTQAEAVPSEMPAPAETAATMADEIPDWLKDLAGEKPAAEAVIPSEELTPAETLQGTELESAAAEIPISTEEAPQAELPTAEEIPTVELPVIAEELPSLEVPAIMEELPAMEEPPITEKVPPVEVPAPAEEVPAVETPTEVPPIVEEVPAEEMAVVPEESMAAEVPPTIEPATIVEIPATAEEIPPVEVPAVAEEAPQAEVPITTEVIPQQEVPPTPAELPVTELPAQPEEAPITELPAVPEIQPQPEQPAQVEEEAFAWLEGLAAEQTAKEEALPTPAVAGEIQPPEWVKLEAEPPIEESIEPQTKPLEAKVVPAEEVPSWIKGLGEQPEIEQPPEKPAETIPPKVEGSEEEELPAWLRELEETVPEEEEAVPSEEGLEWKPSELPAWLKEISEYEPSAEAPASMEAPPTQEVQPAVIEPATQWTEETTPPAGMKREALVETPEEAAQPVAAAPIEMPAAPPPISEVVVVPPIEVLVVEPEVSLETFEAVSKANQTTLTEARNAISKGQPSQAAELFAGLIKQNYHLDEIIKDLQDAVYRFPVDVDMWVTLGDAYLHLDDLQEALSSYTKAEELIR